MDTSLLYLTATLLTPNLGPITAKKIIAYCGGVQNIFNNSHKDLCKIPGIGKTTVKKIDFDKGLELAEQELVFCEKHNITVVHYLQPEYPYRLQQCPDSPLVLFIKGNAEILHKQKILAIVGTRRSTIYGKTLVENMLKDFADRKHDLTTVSGLAYGIDAIAHRSSLYNNIPTVAVLGHGLDRIYPAQHRTLALDILKKDGAIITEFPHNNPYDKTTFLRRNRIIAGMSDAILVAESGITGGALVTADLANGYNRDVFAFPGKVGDTFSAGCNSLIKRNKAVLCEGTDDIEYIMNWDIKSSKTVQKQLFEELTQEEEIVLELFEDDQPLSVDYLSNKLAIHVSKVSGILLGMEFKGAINALPGSLYRKN
jgi:DNA processing protein